MDKARRSRRVINPRRVAEALDVSTDVLVVGGGPAGAWAAVAAGEAGSRVILVDKGYLGTSGATAPSNTGTWFVPPGEGRRAAIEHGQPRAGGPAGARWPRRPPRGRAPAPHRVAQPPRPGPLRVSVPP